MPPAPITGESFAGVPFPPDVQRRIINLLIDSAPFAASLTRQPTNRSSVAWPTAKPSNAAWLRELQPFPEANMGDDAYVVGVDKLGQVLDMSNESVGDAEINLTGELGTLLRDGLSRDLDLGLLLGGGPPEPVGVIGVAAEAAGEDLLEAVTVARGQIGDAGGGADTIAWSATGLAEADASRDINGQLVYPNGFARRGRAHSGGGAAARDGAGVRKGADVFGGAERRGRGRVPRLALPPRRAIAEGKGQVRCGDPGSRTRRSDGWRSRARGPRPPGRPGTRQQDVTRSVAPEPAAPPLVLRCPVVATTRPQPPAISITLPPSPAIAVEWPRVRVTQPRMPGRPSVIRLARTPATHSPRAACPCPAFRAVELMRLHPRSRLASLCRSCAAAGIGTARSTATRPAGARRTGSRTVRRAAADAAGVGVDPRRSARRVPVVPGVRPGARRSRCITSSRGRRAAVTSRGTCGACARPATRESPAGLEARHSRRPLTCGNAREFGRG